MMISKRSNPPRKPGDTFLGTLAPAAAALLTYFLSGGLTVGHTSYVRAGSNKRDGRTVVGQRFSVPSVTFGKEDLLCIDRDGFRTQRGAGKTRILPILLFALSYRMIPIIR